MTRFNFYGFRFRDRRWLAWTSMTGLLLLIAWITTGALVQRAQAGGGGGGGGGGGVLTIAANAGVLRAEADIDICGNATCTSHKQESCQPLIAEGPGSWIGYCGNGGGWKGYSYSIAVNGNTPCTGIAAIGTPAPCGASQDSVIVMVEK